jgi:selenocysteine lyase/cysteine desulfurase
MSSSLEQYFSEYKKNTIGNQSTFISPYGKKRIVYADWLASGRLYGPIERKIQEDFGPFVANTHTETSETGTRMTRSYHHAQQIIKNHVNAGPNDVIINAGSGMTAVVNKLQRIMGLRGCKVWENQDCVRKDQKPVVFVTHMEHHSNHTSWLESFADVIQLEPDKDLLVDPEDLVKKLKRFEDRRFKIGSFTACSNVTGIKTPYYELAKIMHQHEGLCFVDFAASAPYVNINMHPEDPEKKLDAIFFSPHKFLGGPGSAGIMIFDKRLYHNPVPDNPGGGTVDWTNRWGEYKYVDDIEAREDGGTPGFLQVIRAALAIKLKEQMGTSNIEKREKELVSLAFKELPKLPDIKILANHTEDRLGVFSFYHPEIHYNLIVKLLNDRFGIQVRGGCACAGTYGHYLLNVSYQDSHKITQLINQGDLSKKPGWIRWSLHPTTTDEEIYYFTNALKIIIDNIEEWKKDYTYDKHLNEFIHNNAEDFSVENWFSFQFGD